MLLQEHDEVRLRLAPNSPRSKTAPGSPGAPQSGDAARPDEGDLAFTPPQPRTRRAPSADPDVRLGPLGWLAVLLVAVLVTVLAHAGSVRSDQGEHREPSLFVDPAYVLAGRAHGLSEPAHVPSE